MTYEILSARQVDLTLNRLAYEVVERNRGADNVTIVGILNAGAPLAKLLSQQIGKITGRDVPGFNLDISDFRDDRTASPKSQPAANGTTGVAEAENNEAEIDVTDRDVVLVDDVLFTGRTIRAALDAVVRFGRPRSIQLLVLVDRGHREYPIQPDYVGRTLVTKHGERVVVESSLDKRGVFIVE